MTLADALWLVLAGALAGFVIGFGLMAVLVVAREEAWLKRDRRDRRHRVVWP